MNLYNGNLSLSASVHLINDKSLAYIQIFHCKTSSKLIKLFAQEFQQLLHKIRIKKYIDTVLVHYTSGKVSHSKLQFDEYNIFTFM